MRRGAFIVLEGLDRSGKSTQCLQLAKRLREAGHKTDNIRFPDRSTETGKTIDSYLRSASELDDHAVHLLFSKNSPDILSALSAGTCLVCDRYAFSGIAFTAAKSRLPSCGAQPVPLPALAEPDKGLPLPDLIVFLSVSPEVAKARGGYGDERYEKDELQATVRGVFSGSGHEEGVGGMVQRLHGQERWIEVGADGTLEEVADKIWTAVEKLLHKDMGPIGRLWEP